MIIHYSYYIDSSCVVTNYFYIYNLYFVITILKIKKTFQNVLLAIRWLKVKIKTEVSYNIAMYVHCPQTEIPPIKKKTISLSRPTFCSRNLSVYLVTQNDDDASSQF